MKLIARTDTGGMILELAREEASTITEVLDMLNGLSIEIPERLAPEVVADRPAGPALQIDLTSGAQRPPASAAQTRPHVVARLDKKTGERVGEIRKDVTSSGNSRHKKCAACGAAFTDETRANLRKFCGVGACAKAPPKPPPVKTKLTAVTESGSNRNKKCLECGHAFYDESRTNVRKFCGTGGCRRTDTRIPGADRPVRDGRVQRVGDSDMGGGN